MSCHHHYKPLQLANQIWSSKRWFCNDRAWLHRKSICSVSGPCFLQSGCIVLTDQTSQIFTPWREMCFSCHCEYRTINVFLSLSTSVDGVKLLLWVSQNSSNYHTSLYYILVPIVLGNVAVSLGFQLKVSTNGCLSRTAKTCIDAGQQMQTIWEEWILGYLTRDACAV